jgi:hypothetical protein
LIDNCLGQKIRKIGDIAFCSFLPVLVVRKNDERVLFGYKILRNQIVEPQKKNALLMFRHRQGVFFKKILRGGILGKKAKFAE